MIYLMIGGCLSSFFQCICERNSLLNSTRSKCDACKRELKVWELIPILSYLISGGRCRKCRSKIPSSCLCWEILGAAIFTCFGNLQFSSPYTYYFYAVLIAWLLFIAIYDFYYFEVPWSGLIVLFFLGLTICYLEGYSIWFALWFWLCFEAILFIRPHSIGGADTKIFGILSYTIPILKTPYLILFSALCGLLYFLVLRPKQKAIPFIPSILVGYVMTLLITF